MRGSLCVVTADAMDTMSNNGIGGTQTNLRPVGTRSFTLPFRSPLAPLPSPYGLQTSLLYAIPLAAPWPSR